MQDYDFKKMIEISGTVEELLNKGNYLSALDVLDNSGHSMSYDALYVGIAHQVSREIGRSGQSRPLECIMNHCRKKSKFLSCL